MNAEQLLMQAIMAKHKTMNEIQRRKQLCQPLGALYTMVKAYDRDIKTYRKILGK